MVDDTVGILLVELYALTRYVRNGALSVISWGKHV